MPALQLTLKNTMQHYIEEFNQIKTGLADTGLPWVQAWREAALQRFVEQGFPTTNNEEWKYTRVDALTRTPFKRMPRVPHTLTLADLKPYLPKDLSSHRVVFVNGYYDAALSAISQLPKEVQCLNLATALTAPPSLAMADYFATLIQNTQPSFTALNQAFMADGLYLEVPENCHIADPIHLLFITTTAADNQAIYPYNFIIAKANSKVKLLETYVAISPNRYFTNALTEIFIAKDAHVSHCKLQQESDKAFHISNTKVQQETASEFHSLAIALGANLARSDIEVALNAPHAHCNLYGLYAGRGQQHLDQHTRIDHLKPQCTSREVYKGVLDDKARGVFNGKVYVHVDAQKTVAEQSNKNLLLSEHAEADTKPQLEIYADDVKCTHGATVGQLDANAVFFLQTRGIDAEAARSLLTYGFINEVLQQEENEFLRQHLQQLITQHVERI
ncbi:Fe-S cluster assembly protein SufD [soil metagenome]